MELDEITGAIVDPSVKRNLPVGRLINNLLSPLRVSAPPREPGASRGAEDLQSSFLRKPSERDPLNGFDGSADRVGNGVRPIGGVVEDDDRRLPLGGEGLVRLGEEFVLDRDDWSVRSG